MDNRRDGFGQGGQPGRGRNRRPRGRGRGGNQGSSSQVKRFQGLNKDELSGIVMSDSHPTPLSQQFDALHEGPLTLGGKGNPKVKTSLETLKVLKFDAFRPDPPDKSEWTTSTTDTSTNTVIETVDKDIKEHVLKSFQQQRTKAGDNHKDCLEDLAKPFPIVMGQLNKGIKDDIKSDTEWQKANEQNDSLKLITILRDRCHRESNTKLVPALDLIQKAQKLLNSIQEGHKSASNCVEETKVKAEVLAALGASLRSTELIKHTLKTSLADKGWKCEDHKKFAVASDELKQVNSAVDELLLATIIINGSHKENHRNVAQHLEDQHATNQDGCPRTANEAHAMLQTLKAKPRRNNSANHGDGSQNNPPKKKTDGKEDEAEVPKKDGAEQGGEAKSEHAFVNAEEKKADQSKPDPKLNEAHALMMRAWDPKDSSGWVCFQMAEHHQSEASDMRVDDHESLNGLSAWHDEPETIDGDDANEPVDQSIVMDDETPEHDAKEDTPLRQIFTRAFQHAANFVDEPCGQHWPTPTNIKKHRNAERCPQTAAEKCRSDHAPQSAQLNVTEAHAFMQNKDGGRLDPTWVLLDSQATCNPISNRNMVTNIRKHPNNETMSIHCNAGTVKVDTIANLEGFGIAWFCPQGIANILSLALVSDMHRATLDTSIEQAFFMHKLDGTTTRFQRATCNPHVCDTKMNHGMAPTITTVEGQEKMHSDMDARRARAAQKLQNTMMFPSVGEFTKMMDENQMMNCPVTRRDIKMAQDMHGIDPNVVKGKAVRRQPGHVREDISPVPHDILKNCRCVTLAIDIFHVNGIKFFRSTSRHLKFRISRAIRDAEKTTPIECLKTIKGICGRRGFAVVQMHGDNEFSSIADDITKECQATFHPVAKGAHEPFIERDNRTSEERARCTLASAPFNRLPPRMTIELILAVDCWLNSWCSSGGVSEITPPGEITPGIKLDANKHCKFQFGDCVVAFDQSDNSMRERAIDAAFLRTTGNATGGFWVFDLKTARRAHRRQATPAHMTQTIIDRVHAIAEVQGAPIGLHFADMHGNSTILDIDVSSNGVENDVDDDDASDPSYVPDDATAETELTGVVTEPNEREARLPGASAEPPTEHNDTIDEEMSVDSANGDTPTANNDESMTEFMDEDDNSQEHEPMDVHHPGDNEEGSADVAQNDQLEDHEPAEPRRSARQATRSHNKFCGMSGEGPHATFFTAGFKEAVAQLERESHKCVFVAAAIESHHQMEASMVTPQCGARKGLRIFGKAGVDAVLKELKQLHDRKAITPVDRKTLTREDFERAPPCPMLLKRKRSGPVKGRGCADGRSQREFISKEDASSPTVATHAVFLTAIVDAVEAGDVATCDVPGAFLQTDVPDNETVHLRIDGAMADILASLDHDLCDRCVVKRRGGKSHENVTCAKANKAIHRTLRAAPSFWENLSSTLRGWGFEPNPCDSCAANKIINGKQCAVPWHVDDLKISHVDPKVVTDIIDKINKKHGRETPIAAHRGKIHECLGMTTDHSEKNEVKFRMDDHSRDIAATLPTQSQTSRMCGAPAADHLFDVNESAEKLKQPQADMLHHCVAKLLFASKRSRPDSQTAVAFLCTRVQSPDIDDWKKLVGVLGCPKETIFLPLVLSVDGTGNIHWHVDASFAVHNNMRSHTGAMMTLGGGAAMSMSTKQKLDTKSSTEAELVGADDSLPFNMWCQCFLKEQGCHANQCEPTLENARKLEFPGHSNILHQDNTSSIQLERHGKASSTKRTRHINVRFFLVHDKLKRGDMTTIEYVPTADMLGDCFTKPLQGAQFRRLRNAVMGLSDADCLRHKLDCENEMKTKSP